MFVDAEAVVILGRHDFFPQYIVRGPIRFAIDRLDHAHVDAVVVQCRRTDTGLFVKFPLRIFLSDRHAHAAQLRSLPAVQAPLVQRPRRAFVASGIDEAQLRIELVIDKPRVVARVIRRADVLLAVPDEEGAKEIARP